jgi:hypothetical protein
MNSTKENKMETYYSPYGYIQVKKEEYESSNQIISFIKKSKLNGSIKVK